MKAAILSIGDELVSGVTLDTNAAWLAARLREGGVAVAEVRCVGDDRSDIALAIGDLARRNDLLLITGGLGPTPDDLTREALGDVLTPGEPLEEDPDGVDHVERWFQKSGRTMPEANRKQATRPRGATLIENPNGTAPGIRAAHVQCDIVVMPGVPSEMRAMFDAVAPELIEAEGRHAIVTRSIHTLGLGESTVAERLGDLLRRDRQPRIGTTSSRFVVSARIYSTGPREEAERAAARDAAEIERRLRPYVFGCDGATLPQAVGEMLRERGMTLATAESCTGGMVGELLTTVPGSSDYYAGGWITYSNEMKHAELGVPKELLESHGAVSVPVARAMALGALDAGGADLSISITGVAGPGGGSEDKPVGTVFIGCGYRDADRSCDALVRRFRFRGDRAQIRERSAKTALQIVRFRLLGVEDDAFLLGEHREAARIDG